MEYYEINLDILRYYDSNDPENKNNEKLLLAYRESLLSTILKFKALAKQDENFSNWLNEYIKRFKAIKNETIVRNLDIPFYFPASAFSYIKERKNENE